MDATKNKNTPVSYLQEEDNSLFEYLNNLSPLKTKTCVEAALALNSLGMDYSLLASPDATICEDSMVLTRNNILNTSKSQVSSEDINKIYTHEESLTDFTHASLESSSQHKKIELTQAMHDNPCSSEQRPLIISTEEANWALELLGMQVPNGTNVQDESMKDSAEHGTYIQEIDQVEANVEGADCDYNNLSSTTQSMNLLPQSTTNSNYKMQNVEHVASSSKHEIEDKPFEPIAATERNLTQNNLANVALIDVNPIVRGIDELASIKHSITRSCLSYQPEMTSLQINNSVYTPNISSCATKYDEMNAINEKSLLHRKKTSYSQMCVLPRNDIYLNEKMSSGRKSESPRCTSSLHLSARQGHHLSPVPAPMERHLEPSENDDFTKSSVHIPGEDFCRSTPNLMSRVKFNDLTNKLLDENIKMTSKVHSKDSIGLVSSGSEHEMEEESADFCQNVPKRKRKVKKRSDLTGEGGACRSCKCKKSRCLKNYCECFAAGVYCIGPCSCIDCSNKGDNGDTVLQARRKNDSKVVTNSNSSPQFGKDPNVTFASKPKLQKRVCNCNKSGCQRKYCACFKDGVGCSPICKCQGCKNIHGRKHSTAETKSELEETKALQISRTLPPLPYSSMGKLPQISCSELFGSQNQEELVESNATGSITIPDDVNCINTSSIGKWICISNLECKNDVESSPTQSGGRNSTLE